MNYRRKSTRPRQPAAITPARIQRDDNCRFVGYVRVARFPFAFFPSAFLLLTVASLVRLCKGYALARRVEQRVGSRLPGVFAHYCQFCCWNSLKVAEHTDGNGGILVWKENNNNKIINSFGVKETNGWLGLDAYLTKTLRIMDDSWKLQPHRLRTRRAKGHRGFLLPRNFANARD